MNRNKTVSLARIARQARGYTLDQVARLSGICRSHIYFIELGKQDDVPAVAVQAVAAVLGLDRPGDVWLQVPIAAMIRIADELRTTLIKGE
ncbi:MAG: helix-turn-helix transcriptional regulator [bacterium]